MSEQGEEGTPEESITSATRSIVTRPGTGIGSVLILALVCSLSQAATPTAEMVEDTRPGAGSSSPFYLTTVNGTMFFQATDGASGAELWKSDGTAAGTVSS